MLYTGPLLHCCISRTGFYSSHIPFDRVWHAGLLHKLPSYGISGRVYKIIQSFLYDRRFKVVLDGQQSQTFSANSGVPQGSILGPVLFLIFNNGLADNLVSNLGIYADDTAVYSCLDQKSIGSARYNLTRDLQNDLIMIT